MWRRHSYRAPWTFAIAWTAAALAGAACLIAPASPASAQESAFIVTRLAEGQTIRQIAEEYLGDPDLWTEILEASGLQSVTDLVPGIELRIPANEISAANRALADSLVQIQAATLAGAQIFAAEQIGRAINLYDQAQAERVRREWLLTLNLASESHAEATIALTVSNQFRDQPAQALLSDRQGNVEGQRPEDLLWRNLGLQSILIEQERVRTLSDSTAQITFRDASRLRLNANATAVIQVMRVDPLSREEAAKVSLIEGDFYVLLTGESARRTFDVEIPDVTATIQSGDFWVQTDGDTARFANYDDQPVEITTAVNSVTLGQNEGAVVMVGTGVQDKVDIRAPAELITPADGGTIFDERATLAWAATTGAAGYWLELASDPAFSNMVASRFGLEQPGFETDPLPAGPYYWRVAELDQFGLPGQRSPIRTFQRADDAVPPYLTIDAPGEGAILREASAVVGGRSEAGAAVTVNGRPVELAADGAYGLRLDLTEGNNLISVAATDAAGNVTTKERSLVLMSDRTSVVQFDPAIPQREPGHFLSIENVISLSGTTTESATIEFRAADGAVRSTAVADAAGAFHINVPLLAESETFTLAVIAPSGFVSTETISATVDGDPPAVALAAPLPRLTAAASVTFAGTTEPGAVLTLNGELVTITDGNFSTDIALVPGANALELIAADPVGNVHLDRWTVTLDATPPALLGADLQRFPEGDRTRLLIEIRAEDASGLAAAAPITVATPSGNLTGYLRLNRATQTYSGTLSVASADAADARLASVDLRDNAGNLQTIVLN